MPTIKNLDAFKAVPTDRVGVEQVCEKLADVAQSVCVQPMGSVVNVLEDFLELLRVNPVDCAKALGKQAVKLLISSLFSAAIEKHVTELSFLAGLQLHLHELVGAFLEVQARVDRQINRSPQRNQVCFSVVDDFGFLS